jgi:hypothetical protein
MRISGTINKEKNCVSLKFQREFQAHGSEATFTPSVYALVE